MTGSLHLIAGVLPTEGCTPSDATSSPAGNVWTVPGCGDPEVAVILPAVRGLSQSVSARSVVTPHPCLSILLSFLLSFFFFFWVGGSFYCAHFTHGNTLCTTILQNALEGGWHCCQQPRCWMDKCLRKLLHIFYLEHNTYGWMRNKTNYLVRPQELFLVNVRRQKFAWFRHVMCHDGLCKTILQSTLEDGWCCGQQRKCWMGIVKEWTFLPMPELLSRAACRKDWTRISAESSLMFLLTNQSVKGLNWTELARTAHKGLLQK